jgi:hypothetical protein
VVADARIPHVRKAVAEGDLRPGYGLDSGVPGCLRELHGPIQAVVVRERQGRIAQFDGTHDQFFGVGCAVQKGEARVGVKFDIGDLHDPKINRRQESRKWSFQL